MNAFDARHLKALEDQNAKLKKLLADQILKASALRELLSKKWEGRPPGAEIAEGRVKPSTVINLLQEARKTFHDVGEGLECHRIGGLDLKRLHKAFRLGIVIASAAPAHGADQAMGVKMITVDCCSIWADSNGRRNT